MSGLKSAFNPVFAIANLLNEPYGDEAGVTLDRRTIQRWRAGRSLIQRLHNACTVEDEQEIPSGSSAKLKELGVAWEIIAQHSAWLVAKKQEITGRRVAAFHAAEKEFLKTIPAGE